MPGRDRSSEVVGKVLLVLEDGWCLASSAGDSIPFAEVAAVRQGVILPDERFLDECARRCAGRP